MNDEQKIIDDLAAESRRVNSVWLNYKPELIAVGCLGALAGLVVGVLIMVLFGK